MLRGLHAIIYIYRAFWCEGVFESEEEISELVRSAQIPQSKFMRVRQ